jgi:hypothetical protein
MNYNSFTVSPNYKVKKNVINYNNPTLIITSGPTGSGKSSLLKKTLELIFKNKLSENDFKSISIDDYVQNSISYKNKIKNIISDFRCNNTQNSVSCDLVNPSELLLKAFSDAYFEVRSKGPCFEDDKMSCNNYFDNEMIVAMNKGENIIMETTGQRIPLWHIESLFKYAPKDRPYNVIFVNSLVNFDELVIRNKTRALQQLTEFIESGFEGPAPRLPDISFEKYKQSTRDIEKTLITLRNKCMRLTKGTLNICGANENKEDVPLINRSGNYTLLIFDNNDRKSKLIYDSRTNDNLMNEQEFITLISKYNLSGGRIKKYIYKTKNKIKRIKRSKTLKS